MTPIPSTMLQLAGVRAQPASLESATLVIIDAPVEYMAGGLPLPGVEAAIEVRRAQP